MTLRQAPEGVSVRPVWAVIGVCLVVVGICLGVVAAFHPPETTRRGSPARGGLERESFGEHPPDLSEELPEEPYGYVDREAGIGRIPLGDAIEWRLQSGDAP